MVSEAQLRITILDMLRIAILVVAYTQGHTKLKQESGSDVIAFDLSWYSS